ncbi:hypothetical protein F8M41_007176 [Gigaspora margarita]|uniref:Galactose oxidase n=1 Tax=Gigaspora margarita TaxID=4874 RepID=A0A8H3X812_GIGMA|nr:hypothetical protein F8M41_007176 [Gigaspora margarita]
MNFLIKLLITTLTLSASLVNCQFIPEPRYLQTSVILNDSWFFLSGVLGGTDEVYELIYLDLPKLSSLTSFQWNSAKESPVESIFSTSCVSTDNSSIYLIGGEMFYPGTNISITTPHIYMFNVNNSSWITPTIAG